MFEKMWDDKVIYALINIGMSVLIGIVFILAALILQKNLPTDINAVYGYRTKRSMKNKDLWDVGNQYTAEVMKQNGLFMILIGSLIGMLFKYPHTMIAILGLMIVLIICLFIRMENKLKVLEE